MVREHTLYELSPSDLVLLLSLIAEPRMWCVLERAPRVLEKHGVVQVYPLLADLLLPCFNHLLNNIQMSDCTCEFVYLFYQFLPHIF